MRTGGADSVAAKASYASCVTWAGFACQAMEQITRDAIAGLGTRLPDVRARVDNLSGGQRQAIELCRFVHFGGRLVLLDEPFAALGVEQTRRGLDMIDRVKRQGISVIVITHNVLHALQVADRMVVLRQGRVAGVRARAETSHDDLIELITGDSALVGSAVGH